MSRTLRQSSTDKRSSSKPLIDESVLEIAANLESWVGVTDILESSSAEGRGRTKKDVGNNDESDVLKKFKPTSVEHSLLLPTTFAFAVQKRHLAHLAWKKKGRENSLKREDEVFKLTSALVVQAVKALRQLQKHYNNLMSNSIEARNTLIGHNEGSVLWLSPETQPDFVGFISALNYQWGPEQRQKQQPFANDGDLQSLHSPSFTSPTTSSQESSKRIEDLVNWAMDPGIDLNDLDSNVDTSVTSYQTMEQAFRTFRLAFDNMVKLHDGDVNGNFSFWDC